MAVYSSIAKAGPYVADGYQVVFPYAFYALEPGHVSVVVDDAPVTAGLQITVGPEGGSVTFDVPPREGAKVLIRRNVPFTQTVDLQNNTAFYPEVLETAFDKLTMCVQQLRELTRPLDVTDPEGGGGGGGSTPSASSSEYQFAVIDSSEYNTAGALLAKRVSVVNGRSHGATACGTLNGVTYPRTDLTLSDGVSTYYIYASGGGLYALRHMIQSDIVPTLLLATVTFKEDGTPVVVQESFVDNPVILVRDPVCGASTITAVASYSAHVLHYTYRVTAKVLCNSDVLSFVGDLTATPSGETSYLLAYVEKLNVANGVAPVSGVHLTNAIGQPAVSAEWYQTLLSYKLVESGDYQELRITSRAENPYLFTFTTLPLNAAEVNA